MTDWASWLACASDLLRRLFPLCRSLTGAGVRQTLAILREIADFAIHEVPSGTPAYDWIVPDEWNVRDAYVADRHGRRVIDFRQNNLHLVSYSIPFEGTLTFEELRPHLHTLPDLPDAIPYRTSYYNRTWGFCLSQRQFDALDREERYFVKVDTTLAPGSLTYGEKVLTGTSDQKYLISTYCCHPSLGNDNLSGLVLWALLLRELSRRTLKHSYYFLIAPETIGALVWLARNESLARTLTGGFLISTVAGPGKFGYKRTFRGHSVIDRVVRQTFRELCLDYLEYPFDVNGSDERQFSSPAFRIPVGTICKDKYYEYPYYHTSLDNLEFISPEALIQTLQIYLFAIEKLEQNRIYRSLVPYGEPMLGKRGLYPKLGGSIKQRAANLHLPHEMRPYQVSEENILYGSELDAIRWVLFYSDGQTSLLDIAEQVGVPMKQLYDTAENLVQHGLLTREEAA
jgi:aminopeptidase-like protein